MRRRDFVGLLASAAAAWPLAARAQDRHLRRIGVLSIYDQSDPSNSPRVAALREGLAKLAWVEGQNVRLDIRYSGGDAQRLQALADDLVHSAPDLLVVASGPATRAIARRTKTIPIIFVNAGDPVPGGLVANIARPEGNVTGSANMFESVTGKWMELLKEAAPQTARVALVFVPEILNDSNLSTIEAAAKVQGLTPMRMPYRNAEELGHSIDIFASEPNGGLVILPPPQPLDDRATLTRLAFKHRLPTIYADSSYIVEGGLMSYGSNTIDTYRRAATYIDRILRGVKVSDLPVQFPTKFELVVNLKTAKAIGLTVPEAFLLRADEVIE